MQRSTPIDAIEESRGKREINCQYRFVVVILMKSAKCSKKDNFIH